MFKNSINKILEYGTYLLIFLLPLQTRFIFLANAGENNFVEYNAISLYFIDIIIVGLLGLWVIKFLIDRNTKINKVPFFWLLIVGLDLVLVISIFFAGDRLLALYKYGLFLEGIGLFFLIIKNKYNQGFFFLAFYLAVCLQGAIGLVQFLWQESPALKWLGMASHLPGDLGVSVIETVGADGVGERWLRAYGGLDHPNMLGAFLGIGILILLISLSNKKIGDQSLRATFHLTAYLVAIVGIIFSFSRSAWLGLGLAILFLFGSLVFRKKYFVQKNILKNILIASLLVFVLFSSYGNLFLTRFKADGRLETKSQVERLQYRDEAKVIIKNNLLIGVGVGNYVEAEMHRRPGDSSWTFQPVHNVFLLILAETGLFGVLFFIAFLLWVIIKSVRQKDFFNLALLLSLVTMMMFDHFWWSLHFGILFFWFIMGIVVRRIDE